MLNGFSQRWLISSGRRKSKSINPRLIAHVNDRHLLLPELLTPETRTIWQDMGKVLPALKPLPVVTRNDLLRQFDAPANQNDAKLVLEIGFGGGEHVLAVAAQPHTYIIGSECYVNGALRLLLNLDQQRLANVKVFIDDVRALLPTIADNTLNEIFMLYPDPWPKSKQQKRRLAGAWLLDHVQRILVPGGKFWFVSDDLSYFEQVKHSLTADNAKWGLSLESNSTASVFPRMGTKYENKALIQGRVCYYSAYEKQGN